MQLRNQCLSPPAHSSIQQDPPHPRPEATTTMRRTWFLFWRLSRLLEREPQVERIYCRARVDAAVEAQRVQEACWHRKGLKGAEASGADEYIRQSGTARSGGGLRTHVRGPSSRGAQQHTSLSTGQKAHLSYSGFWAYSFFLFSISNISFPILGVGECFILFSKISTCMLNSFVLFFSFWH